MSMSHLRIFLIKVRVKHRVGCSSYSHREDEPFLQQSTNYALCRVVCSIINSFSLIYFDRSIFFIFSYGYTAKILKYDFAQKAPICKAQNFSGMRYT